MAMTADAMAEKSMQIFKLLVAALALLVVSGATTVVDGLVAQLRLDHAALVAAENDFRTRRESKRLVGAEAADYAAYVARLQRRVIEDCVALVRSREALPQDLPCPETLPPLTQSADIDQRAEQTRGEQVAVLDAELNAGLGEYDERLLREQERVKAATPLPDEISGGGGGGGQGDGDGDGDGTGEEGADAEAGSDASGSDAGAAGGEQSSSGTGSRGAGAGGGAQRSGSGTPPDIPDGSDDDVVARQLREAAEKETDPELKKKLWEEYRKYKKGTR
jgi:hypothetical protein